MRAISTVMDVTLCLLLVSASAFVLVDTEPPNHSKNAHAAGSTAGVLATSTAPVNYTIPAEPRPLRRTTHDTLAGLLTDAAVGNATVHGDELTRTSDGFERAVGQRVRSRLGEPTNVQIAVRWEPYRDAHVHGEFVVGESPPTDATVHAATLSVPSGLPTVREAGVDAARQRGYSGVARVVARAIVAGFVPSQTTKLALDDRNRVATVVATRLQRLSSLYASGDSMTEIHTREALVRAMSNRIESELRESFETPEAAARSVSVGRAELVVRTWSK